MTQEMRAAQFEMDHLGPPTNDELDRIESSLAYWLQGRNPPLRRPFDSLYHVGIFQNPSDIDLQLSSYKATATAEQLKAKIAPGKAGPLFDPTYHFIKDEFASLVLPRTFFLPARVRISLGVLSLLSCSAGTDHLICHSMLQ